MHLKKLTDIQPTKCLPHQKDLLPFAAQVVVVMTSRPSPRRAIRYRKHNPRYRIAVSHTAQLCPSTKELLIGSMRNRNSTPLGWFSWWFKQPSYQQLFSRTRRYKLGAIASAMTSLQLLAPQQALFASTDCLFYNVSEHSSFMARKDCIRRAFCDSCLVEGRLYKTIS